MRAIKLSTTISDIYVIHDPDKLGDAILEFIRRVQAGKYGAGCDVTVTEVLPELAQADPHEGQA